MIQNGFENVSVIAQSDRFLITYENRIYRYELRAIREILHLVSTYLKGKDVVLLLQNRGMPVIAVNVCFSQNELYEGEALLPISSLNASLDVTPYWKTFEDTKKNHSSFRKMDIIIHPQFSTRFGSFHNPVKTQINLAPEIRTSLWKGMALSLQWIIPIKNELDEEGDSGRPGLLTFNQIFRLPSCTFISATCGYFSNHRYGFDVESTKYFANGRLSFNLNAGYTGYASYSKGTWYYSAFHQWTYFIGGGYRFPNLDLTVQLTGGQFLYGDKGLRLDVVRQFGEVDIGFFTFKTEKGTNGGFHLSVPLFPSKRMTPRRIRITPAIELPLNYQYYWMPNCGIQYSSGTRIYQYLKKLSPDFIEMHTMDQ